MRKATKRKIKKARLCDLVMKGGITSGVIYPRLVSTLAKVYQFKSIGGTSAGAIAATGAAAAEYGRQHGNAGAFDELDKLPQELVKIPHGKSRSMLFHLFQPSASLQHHFSVLVGALNAPDKASRVGLVLSGLIGNFRGAALLGAMPWMLALFAVVSIATNAISLQTVAIAVAAALVWFVALIPATATCFLFEGVFRTTKLRAPLFGLSWVAFGIGFVAVVLSITTPYAALAPAMLAAFAIGAVVVALAVSAVTAAAIRFVVTLGRALPPNNFGMCTGMPQGHTAQTPEALTPWLYEYFNRLAGKKPGSAPLTFGDLWGCSDATEPTDREQATGNAKLRKINLEMMTTAVSQGLPYRLPFNETASRTLLFDPQEWKDLFPQPVCEWLRTKSEGSNALNPDTGAKLRRLPAAADFPVVVATRMSLSFPILLSAIPLYAVDYSLRRNNRARNPKATRVWFSDGGISSNLPLHFFDSRLPSHPTFAIGLKRFHPDYQPRPREAPGYETGRVHLAKTNNQGRMRHWEAQTKNGGLVGTIGFLWSIVTTMQNWGDEILFPYPGYRDRIVQISQKEDEGGLNLDMPPSHIAALAAAGENAAKELIDRFASPSAGGWRNHRAVRLRTLMGQMEDLILEVDAKDSRSREWRDLLQSLPCYPFDKPVSKHVGLGLGFFDNVRKAAKPFRQAAQHNKRVSLTNGVPRPVAELRTSPKI